MIRIQILKAYGMRGDLPEENGLETIIGYLKTGDLESLPVLNAQIKSIELPARMAIEMCRDMEIRGGEVDRFKNEHGYYEPSRELQQVQDRLFQDLNPDLFAVAELIFGGAEQRWDSVSGLVEELKQIAKANHWPGARLAGRAKSTWGLMEKMLTKRLDKDEIWDAIGVRIYAWDDADMQVIKEGLLGHYTLMVPHKFRHPEEKANEWHQPIRDYYSEPKQGGYRAFHMNLVHSSFGIIEAQLTTREAYMELFSGSKEPQEIPLARMLTEYK
jgi:hypothetical protein